MMLCPGCPVVQARSIQWEHHLHHAVETQMQQLFYSLQPASGIFFAPYRAAHLLENSLQVQS